MASYMCLSATLILPEAKRGSIRPFFTARFAARNFKIVTAFAVQQVTNLLVRVQSANPNVHAKIAE